jgi:hypothetical protein
MNMSTVPRAARVPSVPLADVRRLLDTIEAVLDMPTADIPDVLRCRLAHASGVLSTVTDERGIRAAASVLRRVVDSAKDGAQDEPDTLPDDEPAPDYPVVDHTRPRDYGRTGWRGAVRHLRQNPNGRASEDWSLCGLRLFVSTIVGEGARLCVRCDRFAAASRTPYDADHVAYVHEAGEVTALYIPNREHAADPKGTWAKCQDSLAWWRASGVEVIGSIVRDGRRWYWEGPDDLGPFPDGDPTTKRAALPGLRRAAALHFERTDGAQ